VPLLNLLVQAQGRPIAQLAGTLDSGALRGRETAESGGPITRSASSQGLRSPFMWLFLSPTPLDSLDNGRSRARRAPHQPQRKDLRATQILAAT